MRIREVLPVLVRLGISTPAGAPRPHLCRRPRLPSKLILAAALPLAGCFLSPTQVPVMRESDYRFPPPPPAEAKASEDAARTERVPLPLDGAGDSRAILAFLAADGDNARIQTGAVVDPAVHRKYGALLEALKTRYTKAQVRDQNVLKQWLGKPVSGVFDARWRARQLLEPLALSDGRFWWILYPDAQGNLAGLAITKVTGKVKPLGK